ncbi:MAG: hypothetical protein OXQ84_22900 [bacterium]|nr:hypothetical protein [bacterium]
MMSARAVRVSGVVALATVLIVPGSAFLVGSVTPSGPANIERALGQIALLTIVMYYAFVGCSAFVLWATKQVFNASGYRSADVLVAWLFGVLVFLPPLAFPLWAWFSILAIRFGRRVGSPLWQVIGVIYLIAVVLLAAAIAIDFAGVHIPDLDAFMVFSGLMLLVAWLFHGVCLIISARKLAG